MGRDLGWGVGGYTGGVDKGYYSEDGEIDSQSIDESVSSEESPGPVSYPTSVLRKLGMNNAKAIITKKAPREPN